MSKSLKSISSIFKSKQVNLSELKCLSTYYNRNYSSITSETNNSINLDGKYYVHKLDNPGPPLLLRHEVRGLPMSPSVRINEIQQQMILDGKHIYRMGFGQSPFPVPNIMINNLILNANNNNYVSSQGLYELRESIANLHNNNNNSNITANDVMIGPGSKELLFLLQLCYYGELLVPSPSWVSYTPQAAIIGTPFKWLQTNASNDWKLTPKELRDELESDSYKPRILILNYPNNPAGIGYTTDELKELASICKEQRIIVVSDEIYSPLMHEQEDGTIPKFDSISKYYSEGTIILTGISKWAGAGGWRQGAFIFPPNMNWLLQSMTDIASNTFQSVSTPIQYGSIPAFRDFYGPEMTEYFRVQRKVFGGLGHYGYNKLLECGADVVKPTGAFYIFPDFSNVPNIHKLKENWAKKHNKSDPNEFSSKDLTLEVIEETGVAGLGGHCFGRPMEELTMKLSIVDFAGKDCLEHKDELPSNIASQEMIQFMKKYTPNVIKGYDALSDFFKSL